jgi:hypothetical protein
MAKKEDLKAEESEMLAASRSGLGLGRRKVAVKSTQGPDFTQLTTFSGKTSPINPSLNYPLHWFGVPPRQKF